MPKHSGRGRIRMRWEENKILMNGKTRKNIQVGIFYPSRYGYFFIVLK
jgi:hypothetical protein